MAAFGNSSPQGFLTSDVTSNSYPRVVIIIGTRSSDDYTGRYDNQRFWPPYSNLDYLVKEFKRVCRQEQERSTLLHRARARGTGRDYRTPAGVRPYWFKPEPPAGELPEGLSHPRWRDYQRRRA